MKVVAITGASGGIGNQLVNDFKKAGYTVISLDINQPKINDENFIKMDLSSSSSIEAAFQEIKEKFKYLDVLINNGAIMGFERYVQDVSSQEVDMMLDTNIKGSYLCVKQFVKLNANRPYGRIINIASTRWHQNEANWDLYGMSKGALVSMTNSLCVSLIDTKITVNAISPGWIETKNYAGLSKEDHKNHPSGRVGKPEDIGRACLFLADEENDFINGTNLLVDGGMTKKMIY